MSSILSGINPGIRTINQFSQILDAIPTQGKALFLIDADECAIQGAFGFDRLSGLGDPAWRLWCKGALNQLKELKNDIQENINQFDLFSAFSLYAAKYADYRAVGDFTDAIHAIQSSGNPAFVLTARGSRQWYSITLESDVIRTLTKKHFDVIGVNFEQNIPDEMKSITVPVKVKYLDSRVAHDDVSIADGLMFTSNTSKLDFLVNVIQNSGFSPDRIIFIDDKMAAVGEIEKAVNQINKLNESRVRPIEYFGYNLTFVADEQPEFDPVVCNVQLERLLFNNEIITGEAALKAANEVKNQLASDGIHEEKYGVESLRLILEKVIMDRNVLNNLNPA
jgi:hypothetical protein